MFPPAPTQSTLFILPFPDSPPAPLSYFVLLCPFPPRVLPAVWEAFQGPTTRDDQDTYVLSGSLTRLKSSSADTGMCRVVALVALIGRSKLIPDFALTLHFLHLLVVYFYTGLLPRHAMWWLTMLASSAATVALGVWGCRWRELRPISFGGVGGGPAGGGRNAEQGGGAAGGAPDENGHAGGPAPGEDEEMGLGGFSRGRGRGRGRDGAGEYEMVGLKPNDR